MRSYSKKIEKRSYVLSYLSFFFKFCMAAFRYAGMYELILKIQETVVIQKAYFINFKVIYANLDMNGNISAKKCNTKRSVHLPDTEK